MKAYRSSADIAALILTLTLDGFVWLVSYPACFTLPCRKETLILIEGWVGARASLDILDKRLICNLCKELNPRSFSL
jgi:hypothetical protein